MTSLTDLERTILLACRSREERLARSKPSGVYQGHHKERCRLAGLDAEVREQKEFGPRWNATDWGVADGSEAAQRRAIRAVYNLGATGLLSLTRTGRRLTHVKLTESGRKVAQALLKGVQ